MGFPVGTLNTITRKRGTFGHYDVIGVWVSDTRQRRGWFIELDGLDSGSFAVSDGEIHLSGRHYFAGPNGETIAPVSSEHADLRVSARQAILDAVAKWESEERENPCT